MDNYFRGIIQDCEVVGYILKTYEKISPEKLKELLIKYRNMAEMKRRSDKSDFILTFKVKDQPKMYIELMVGCIKDNNLTSCTFVGTVKMITVETGDVKFDRDVGFQFEYHYKLTQPSYFHLSFD